MGQRGIATETIADSGQYVSVDRDARARTRVRVATSLLATLVMAASCGDSTPAAHPGPSGGSGTRAIAAPKPGECWPIGTAADGSAQTSPITVANVQLSPADPQPPPLVTAAAARQIAGPAQQGALALRTVFATVVSPSTRVSEKVWVVIGCDVPFTSKGPASGASGVATVVAAVDPRTGQLLFSATAQS